MFNNNNGSLELLLNNSKGEVDELLAVMGLGFQEHGNEMIALLFIMHILLRACMDGCHGCGIQPLFPPTLHGRTKFQTPFLLVGPPQRS
jgi:hypothetical protein